MSAKTAGIPAITGEIDESVAVRIFPSFLSPYRSAIIAYFTLAVSTTIGYPFDTVKTRMQTYQNFTSVFDCVKKSYHSGGLLSFYQGLWAPMVSTAFVRSVNVSVFTNIKPMCHKLMVGADSSLSATHPFLANIPVCFAAGAAAGLTTSLIACPFEFSKLFSQIEHIARKDAAKSNPSLAQTRYTTLQTVNVITKNLGYKGLYSGYKYHSLRDGIGSGVYYAVYESFKWACNGLINGDPAQSSPVSILAAGGISGATCWAVIFPFDTTKALIQKDIVSNILRHENGQSQLPLKKRKLEITRRMYRGLGISMYRSVFVNMVFFSCYEFSMKHFI